MSTGASNGPAMGASEREGGHVRRDCYHPRRHFDRRAVAVSGNGTMGGTAENRHPGRAFGRSRWDEVARRRMAGGPPPRPRRPAPARRGDARLRRLHRRHRRGGHHGRARPRGPGPPHRRPRGRWHRARRGQHRLHRGREHGPTRRPGQPRALARRHDQRVDRGQDDARRRRPRRAARGCPTRAGRSTPPGSAPATSGRRPCSTGRRPPATTGRPATSRRRRAVRRPRPAHARLPRGRRAAALRDGCCSTGCARATAST